MTHYHPQQQQQEGQYHDISNISNRINKRVIKSMASHNAITPKQRIRGIDSFCIPTAITGYSSNMSLS